MNWIRSRRWAALALLLALCAALCGCGARTPDAARVSLDGAAWNGETVSPAAGGLRVYVALDGKALIDLPFDEAHTVAVTQPDGAENVIELTGASVYMNRANCENQDCVEMGAVTADNLEIRALGGFIVCLPHRLSVEVREP